MGEARPNLLDMLSTRPAREFSEAMRWAIKAGMTGVRVGDRAVHFFASDPLKHAPVVDGPPAFVAWYRFEWETAVITCRQIAMRTAGEAREAACDARVDTATESIGELLRDLASKVDHYLTTWKNEAQPT